jgi:hypothetical protein
MDTGLPLLQFLGGLALVAAQFGDQRDHPGIDARHQPGRRSCPCRRAPATRWRRRADRLCPRPLVRTRSSPERSWSQRLERRDAGIATDLEGDDGGRKLSWSPRTLELTTTLDNNSSCSTPPPSPRSRPSVTASDGWMMRRWSALVGRLRIWRRRRPIRWDSRRKRGKLQLLPALQTLGKLIAAGIGDSHVFHRARHALVA